MTIPPAPSHTIEDALDTLTNRQPEVEVHTRNSTYPIVGRLTQVGADFIVITHLSGRQHLIPITALDRIAWTNE